MLKFKHNFPGGKNVIIREKIKVINYNIKNSNTFILKENYDSILPLNVYTCWHTKDLPPLMKKNYDKLILDNSELKFNLYDENECREFIKKYFNSHVLNAYDSLIPCSYKSDLWRYCVLYIYGGIYIDIKFGCVNNFKLISLTEKEYFVRDRDPPGGTLTGLIACKPGNVILFSCISFILQNVKYKFYGKDSLCPTGPGLLGRFFTTNQKKQMELYFENCGSIYYICYNNIIILKMYDEYRVEQSKYQKNHYYANLWNQKQIYK
jgi:mannosyltransferase OCH1-like enzyme